MARDRTWRSSVSTRFLGAFGLLLLLLGLVTALALYALDDLRASLQEVLRAEQGLQSSLELSSAVRDQYAHQAHTIIIGNDSHLGLYRESRKEVVRLIEQLRGLSPSEEQRSACDEIAAASANLDRLFLGKVVPAVLAREPERIRAEHADAQELVSVAQDAADELASSFRQVIEATARRAADVQRTAARSLILGLATATLASLLVGAYLTLVVRRPLARLTAGTTQVRSGDLGTQIAVTGPREFAVLAQNFNDMTAALSTNAAALAQAEKLAGVGRLAAGVAHEINNPLTVILGYVRVLKRKAEPPLSRDLEVIEAEAVQCQNIVDSLLALSRPRVTPAESVDLGLLVSEVSERTASAWPGRRPAIVVEGRGTVLGHPALLRQVFTNLLRNAIEAGGPGPVRIRIEAGRTEVRIDVLDTGPGLPEVLRARLFEPFFTTKADGTGLGLALAQAIARAHGGRIETDFTPSGTRFSLALPQDVQP